MTLKKKDLQVPGTYILLIRVGRNLTIGIGALGESYLRHGWYVYVGSAFGPGGLYARLRHHCYSGARPRWHIDYLRQHVPIREIIFSCSRVRLECRWAEMLAELPQSRTPVPGFGASDCRCQSHLFYFPARPVIAPFRSRSITRDQFWLLEDTA